MDKSSANSPEEFESLARRDQDIQLAMEHLGSGGEVVLKRELAQFKWDINGDVVPQEITQMNRGEFSLR